MAAKLTRLTHKIAIQLHLVAESCNICSSRSRRPVRKLLDTPSYISSIMEKTINQRNWDDHTELVEIQQFPEFLYKFSPKMRRERGRPIHKYVNINQSGRAYSICVNEFIFLCGLVIIYCGLLRFFSFIRLSLNFCGINELKNCNVRKHTNQSIVHKAN
jgi:hypothetical protein